mmetsp:Transcript_13804/g.20675  ORF Transcript_13804/g.20675 Transcript_13804/m.20675 type:complete len:318 (+) Transcript_13804:57-1010(+)
MLIVLQSIVLFAFLASIFSFRSSYNRRRSLLLQPIGAQLTNSQVHSCRFRFLESNTWDVTVNNVNIFIDPVMSQLDFGIPLLYTGNKKVVNGPTELKNVATKSDIILISQGFDDHAHRPTLTELSKSFPTKKYVCPPSAKPILLSCGVKDQYISTIRPGEMFVFTNEKGNSVEIKATTGALLGPPWQPKENGYLIRALPTISSVSDKYDLYYEPHCMFDEQELSQFSADVVITPIVSQELPAYTLVAGGEKALRLAQVLNAKFVVPMANGNLKQEGLLSVVISSSGSEAEFNGLLERSGSKTKLVSAPAGQDRMFLL